MYSLHIIAQREHHTKETDGVCPTRQCNEILAIAEQMMTGDVCLQSIQHIAQDP